VKSNKTTIQLINLTNRFLEHLALKNIEWDRSCRWWTEKV